MGQNVLFWEEKGLDVSNDSFENKLWHVVDMEDIEVRDCESLQ